MELTKEEMEKTKEDIILINKDNFECIDLTELAAKKYPHLEDDCE